MAFFSFQNVVWIDDSFPIMCMPSCLLPARPFANSQALLYLPAFVAKLAALQYQTLSLSCLWNAPEFLAKDFCLAPAFAYLVGDRKGTTKKLCDKDFAERSGELLVRFASKPLF